MSVVFFLLPSVGVVRQEYRWVTAVQALLLARPVSEKSYSRSEFKPFYEHSQPMMENSV